MKNLFLSQLKQKNDRNSTIDILKGIAIFLVVLGHLIQNQIPNYDNNYIFKFIYSFHMPIFMIIAGFLACLSNNKSFKKLVIEKFIYLVIPFLSWHLFNYYSSQEDITLIQHMINLIKAPDYGLWFLWVLWVLFISFYFFTKINLQSIKLIYVILLISIIPLSKFLGFNLLKWYSIFFYLGVILAIYKNSLMVIFNSLMTKKYFKTILIVLFFVLLNYWSRDQIHFFLNSFILFYLFKGLMAILGSLVLLIIVIKFKKELFPLQIVGSYTFSIYIIHFQIIKLVEFSNINIELYKFIVIFISIIIYKILKKIPIIDILFFGIISNNKAKK